jgi:glycosyltransferase involved in cell wall biosynthesis
MMTARRISIGVHVHADPAQLDRTLACLRSNTTQPFELLLLPDGADAATRAALDGLNGITQSGTEDARGAPACFNRLASCTDAEVLVLLESGAQVAPRWLEHLLAALDADPGNGLAGPSTNRCWNEQQVFPRCGAWPASIERTAREAVHRFGSKTLELSPLYSLSDFCYVVRREVFEAIGEADESYGLGPCWEMDFNIRAARAGFRGVWACAAFVHRAPFTRRRKIEEAALFEASKRLYQNKFCGARLRGDKTDFRNHCRGDACPNFAPRGLIRLRQSLPSSSTIAVARVPPLPIAAAVKPRTARGFDQSARPLKPEHQVRAEESLTPVVEPSFKDPPLVSCIMPTCNRRHFLPQAIRCFLRQDYPNRELLIIDDGSDAVGDLVPEEGRVRYLRLPAKLRIGAKRNLACEAARGEFIVHWDDDDWYPTNRISVQMQALVERGVDVSGTSRILYFDAMADKAWEYRYASRHGSWVGGNTMAYRKSFWERNRFPDIQIGEDSRFLWSRTSKTVHDLADSSLCVASIHSSNTSRKMTSGSYWHAQPNERVHELLGDDRYFYRVPSGTTLKTAWPLVSCIMPTSNRRSFVSLALNSFAAQDYPNKELIIIDDGDDRVDDLTPGVQGVRYVRLPRRTSIGAKRNLACEQAQGEIIAHWDDDDWYAPDRLRYQVGALLAGEADMTGLFNSCVLELPGGNFWTTLPTLHRRMFVGDVHGGTLVYRKELLSGSLRYPEINLAEDAWLVNRIKRAGKRLLRLANPGVFIYVRHGRNAWRQCQPGRFINPGGWQRINQPGEFSTDVLAAYREAAALLR